MSKDWLNNLEAGSPVIISGGGPMSHDAYGIVERFTKTQIVIENSSTKYRRNNGHSIGSSMWGGYFLREATSERLSEIKESQKRRKIIGRLSSVDWKLLKTGHLVKMYNALEEES